MKCSKSGCFYEAAYFFQRWADDRVYRICPRCAKARWKKHIEANIWPLVELEPEDIEALESGKEVDV